MIGYTYTKVRGSVVGYGRGSPDAFRTEALRYGGSIDDAYVDGVVFAQWTPRGYGAQSARVHVATYANGLSYSARDFGYYVNGNCYLCHGGSDPPPAWLDEREYYCDSHLRAASSS